MSECRFCHNDSDDGGITSRIGDDGFGTLRKNGLIADGEEQWGHTCWDCVDKLEPFREAVEKRKRAHFAEHNLCGFLEAWIGHCLNPLPCQKHATQRCWKCGAPATKNCEATFALVCGVPECDEHPHEHPPGYGEAINRLFAEAFAPAPPPPAAEGQR